MRALLVIAIIGCSSPKDTTRSNDYCRRRASFTSVPATPLSGSTGSSIPAHTYSIVARDPTTGDLGVAVQSHYFSVGSAVMWAEPGVGAVATQSFVEKAYGP